MCEKGHTVRKSPVPSALGFGSSVVLANMSTLTPGEPMGSLVESTLGRPAAPDCVGGGKVGFVWAPARVTNSSPDEPAPQAEISATIARDETPNTTRECLAIGISSVPKHFFRSHTSSSSMTNAPCVRCVAAILGMRSQNACKWMSVERADQCRRAKRVGPVCRWSRGGNFVGNLAG